MFSAIHCSTKAFYSLSLAPTDKIILLYAGKNVVTPDDLQGQFLAQHSLATWLRHCSSRTNNVATLQLCVALKIVVANRPV